MKRKLISFEDDQWKFIVKHSEEESKREGKRISYAEVIRRAINLFRQLSK